jgi:hypothetical protein
MKPARSQFSILKQVCTLIPGHLVARLSREHGVDKKCRTFSAWSHVVALLYAQLAHSGGLNSVCDGLQLHRGALGAIRGATPPCRNTFSNANKVRSAAMGEALFFAVLAHLKTLSPSFGGKTYGGFPRRFKRTIHVVDSSTIQLVADCIDWAKHRRKKAAAKLHLRLDLQSFLPSFAIVDTAKHNDNKRAREMCADIGAGEIALFDKAYVDFLHLHDLDARGAFWVTRAKDNLQSRCVERHLKKPHGKILRDDEIILTTEKTRGNYPKRLRLIHALVEVNGEEIEMRFMSNNLQWAASSIVELYKKRWAIEAFFKQLKQTLQLGSFLGHNKNAIQWQVWMALLAYVLLRFLAHQSTWHHSFSRLVGLLRSSLWTKLHILATLKSYGTASGHFRLLNSCEQCYLPHFTPP